MISILCLFGGYSGCGSPDCGGWYRGMAIDARTARVRMTDRLATTLLPSDSGFRDDVVQAGHVIDQLGPETADRWRPRMNFFFADSTYRLLYRQKDQELLRGPFGSVYGKSVYFYDVRYKGQPTGFEVETYSKIKGVETPTIVDKLPASLGELCAISLVRVVRAHPEYATFAATYSVTGQIQSLNIGAARGGDWVGAGEFIGSEPPINGGGFYAGAIDLRPWYGIPRMFPVDYQELPRVVWPESGFPEQLTAVHLHYDRNRWVRQDTYREGVRASTRYLNFPSTQQDLALEVVDLNRGFGRWTDAKWD